MSHVTFQYVSRVLLITGGVCGLWGAGLMANQYTRAVRSPLDLIVLVLIPAIFRRRMARGAARFSEVSEENKASTVRGLGLIFVGFLLQVIGGLMDLFTFR